MILILDRRDFLEACPRTGFFLMDRMMRMVTETRHEITDHWHSLAEIDSTMTGSFFADRAGPEASQSIMVYDHVS